MSGSLNRVILMGHLGADPEIRHTQDGRPIANFSLATSESWKDKNTGEKRERTEWHRVVIFTEGLAKLAEQYLKKGSRVYIDGQIKTRKWQDNNGQDRYSTEIVLDNFKSEMIMLGAAGSGRPPSANDPDEYGQAPAGNRSTQQSKSHDAGALARDMDDDIPF